MNARSAEDGPWAWFNKGAVNRIREVMGENNAPAVSSVLVTYFALVELASDLQADRFEARRGLIASKAGIKERTLDAAMVALEKIGLVAVERRRIDVTTNLPSLYTLLAPPSATIAPPPSAINAPLGQDTDLASLARCIKNHKNQKESERRAPPSLAQWLAYADGLQWPHADASAAFDHYEANGWRQAGGNTIKSWQAAARNCHRRGNSHTPTNQPQRPEPTVRRISAV